MSSRHTRKRVGRGVIAILSMILDMSGDAQGLKRRRGASVSFASTLLEVIPARVRISRSVKTTHV
jgi:hypothetical protein